MRSSPIRRPAIALLVAALGAVGAPPLACAQSDLEASNRATARQMGEEALSAYRAERWAEALVGFRNAQKLIQLPTLATFEARCEVRLGRLVEASESYRRAIATAIDSTLTPAQQEGQRSAQKEAWNERDALLPRIPTLAVETDYRPGATDELRLDGTSLPLTQLGVARWVDPGPHHVEIVRDGRVLDAEDVTLSEGTKRSIRLEIGPPPSPAAETTPAETGPHRDGASKGFAVVGWTAVALGGAALVTSGVTFAAATSINTAELGARCPDAHCSADKADTVATYEALGATSIGTLVAGAALATVGFGFLLVSDDQAPAHARAQVRVSARGAAVALPF